MIQFDELVQALSEFLVPLRTGEPLDRAAFQGASQAIESLADSLRDRDSIPKELVRILVDVYPQMQGIASLRKDEAERFQIEDWAEDLLERIHLLFD